MVLLSYYFNTSYVSVQVSDIQKIRDYLDISIHRMCRFKIQFLIIKVFIKMISIHRMCRFKNANTQTRQRRRYFNTSYVSVQVKEHLNTLDYTPFQYIVCVGSSYQIGEYKISPINFNTSYVSVQAKQLPTKTISR